MGESQDNCAFHNAENTSKPSAFRGVPGTGMAISLDNYMLKHGRLRAILVIYIAMLMAGFLTSSSYANASQPDESQTPVIRVVTKEIQPFVIKEAELLTGFSIDLWEEVSLITGLPYELRTPFLGVETIEVAFELLESGGVDAVVYDAPVLQYYMANFGQDDLAFIGPPFLTEYYGIALPMNSPYEETINRALLEIWANGTHQELMTKWQLSEVDQ
jgi:ABC-type amino acid transport substrate-binding protein